MMYWGNGMGGWGMTLMTVSSLLFWGMVVAAIVALVRYAGRVGQPGVSAAHGPAPQQLLAERFARGDIDEDEYTRRLHVLGAPPPGSAPGI
jgi:putative membrane protein